MKYIVRRVIIYLIVLIIAANLDFILPRLTPGNAAFTLSSGTLITPEERQLLAIRFGLNQSIFVQYYLFFKNVFATWPPYFGVSSQYYPIPVTQLFWDRIGWTLLLILSTLFLSLAIAYVMAMITSLRRKGKLEQGFLYTSIAFQATPVYWTAMIVLWVFAVTLAWFPIFGGTGYGGSTGINYVLSVIWHSVLPVVAMTASVFGESYVLLRSSTQEVLKSDYVTAAKTRGLRNRVVANAYVMRNSLLPLVSFSTFSISSLISRVILVEAIFGYPGVGDLLVDAIVNRDYPVIEGSMMLLTMIIIVGGLIGDLLLVRLDPRLRK